MDKELAAKAYDLLAEDRRHYLELVKTYHRMKAWDDAHKEAA